MNSYIYTSHRGTTCVYDTQGIRAVMEANGLRHSELQGHMEDLNKGATLTADNGATFRAETAYERRARRNADGHEAAAKAFADNPGDFGAIGRAMAAGAYWSRQSDHYALSFADDMSTLALVDDDGDGFTGTALDKYRTSY